MTAINNKYTRFSASSIFYMLCNMTGLWWCAREAGCAGLLQLNNLFACMRLINIIGSRRIRQGIYNMELWEVKGQMAVSRQKKNNGRLKTAGGKHKRSFYFIQYLPILLDTSEKLLFLGSDLPSILNYCGQCAFKINLKKKRKTYNRKIPCILTFSIFLQWSWILNSIFSWNCVIM